MEARFDVETIQLPDRARAIDGSMFHREAWGVLSKLYTGTSCRLMLYGQAGPARGAPSA